MFRETCKSAPMNATASKIGNASEAANLLGVKVNTVLRWQRMGLIPVIKMGHRSYLFDLERVRDAVLKLEIPAQD